MATTTTSPLRIAILETDTPLPGICAKWGSYGGVFASLLHKAADASHLPRDRLHLSGWDVVNSDDHAEGSVEEMGGQYDWTRTRGYPSLQDIDAILITGSKHDSYRDDPWITRLCEYTRQALASDRVRVIGVCFGHQIVGRVLGAKVARSDPTVWEVSVCQYAQTAKGQELFHKQGPLSLMQMHKDIVYYYPPGVEELGSSDGCKVQGMYVKGKCITVQGHPEFTEEIVREILDFRSQQGVFTGQMYEDAKKRLGDRNDGVLVAQAFLEFVMDG